jgi:hypothetical protein
MIINRSYKSARDLPWIMAWELNRAGNFIEMDSVYQKWDTKGFIVDRDDRGGIWIQCKDLKDWEN